MLSGHQSVSSSNLASVAYDEAAQILEICFKNGGVYQYHGVPLSVYLGLMSAPSVGQYFHRFIKDNYPCYKVA